MHYKKESAPKKPKSVRGMIACSISCNFKLSSITFPPEYEEENFESLPARALYAVPKPTIIVVSLFAKYINCDIQSFDVLIL